jgi:hypothetical protein
VFLAIILYEGAGISDDNLEMISDLPYKQYHQERAGLSGEDLEIVLISGFFNVSI